MSKLPKTMQEQCQPKRNHPFGNHQKYVSRITKTLYYGKFPKPEGLSLPLTELAAELFSEAQRGRSLGRLHYDDASTISRNACVSPCSLIFAILYLERLKKVNPEYLEKTAPSDLFLVSLMVSCKFLYDDGEVDEVFIDEWALSAGISVKYLVQLEKDFLKAIDWEVFINKPTFWNKLTEIETTLARKEGSSRGFFTYTELHRLLDFIELHKLTQNILALSIILVTSYTAAILTLFGSVLIVSHIPGTSLVPKKYDLFEPGVQSYHKFETNLNTKSEEVTRSTEGLFRPSCNATETATVVSWDWWTVPAMKWLSTTTTIIEDLQPEKFSNLIDSKTMNLQGEILKSTSNKDMKDVLWQWRWSVIENKHLYHYRQNVK